MLGAYLYTIIGYYFIDKEEFKFGYFAMWEMSFFVYCLLLLAGLVIGLVLRSKSSNLIRYATGFFVGPVIVLGLFGILEVIA